MHFKYCLLLIIFSLPIAQSSGQPIPCEDPPVMTSFCADACIICDIDGFTGRHESTIVGQAPPGFAGECTFVAHNMQWIAFIAGSTDLSIELAVSNCQQNLGLEFGLYRSIDCENFERISNCFGGAAGIIGPGQSGVINNTVPLVIGQYYYIVMDGGLGDNCNWTFSVLSGSTEVSPLTTSGEIQGNNTSCPDLLQQYFIDPPVGATEFEWSINGAIEDINEPSLNYIFPNEGTYTVCVTAKNACDEAPQSCLQVLVESIPNTVIEAVLCEGEVYEIAGETLTQGGNYTYDLISDNGCDSLVVLSLTEVVTPLLELDLQICEGDSIFIGSEPYTSSGSYQQILTSYQNCDSVVNLNLNTIICNITSNDNPIPVICHGESSGMIEFLIESGTPPFTYSWQELNGQFNGTGSISNLGELVTISNIPAGTYIINVADGFGNFDVIISEVSQPEILAIEFEPSNYNGLNLTCDDSNDGNLLAEVSGGVPQFSYNWSNGMSDDFINSLGPGLYELTVTDMVGCTIEGSYELLAPDPMLLIAGFQNPECFGAFTGSITAIQTLGGTGSYQYSLNGSDFTEDPVFEGIGEGIYTLEVMDENACLTSATDTIVTPQIPEISFDDDFEVDLGTSVLLDPDFGNIDIASINWESSELLDCPECPEQNIIPLNSTYYTVEVSSIDGCIDTDSIYIGVNKFRKIYIPNAFTPNFDGFNDYFTIYGGSEVANIKLLRVFDRWGAVVFEGHDLLNGFETDGWNGVYKGKSMDPGVYAWMAEVQFIDGVILTYSGDISIVK